MNEREFYLNRMFASNFYSNISSLLSTRYHNTFSQTMQTIESYMPSSPNLHLTPFQSVNNIVDDVNPLNYRLTANDFVMLTLPSGQLLYALDPTTGTSLWWALRRIARVIMCAAAHSILIDPSLPIAQCAYIPQFQFDRIAMQRPAILSTLGPDCMNPLYGYTSRENIQGWFNDFKNMGRQAVQWIRTARTQSAYLGLYSGWNWEALPQDLSRLEFPDRYLIKGLEAHANSISYVLPSDYDSSVSDSFSDIDGGSVMPDEDITTDNGEYGKQSEHELERLKLKNLLGNRSLVLHPLLLAYAKRYVNYDVFSGEPLIDNGYVERGAGDLTPYTSMSSPLDSTAFAILSLPEVRDD